MQRHALQSFRARLRLPAHALFFGLFLTVVAVGKPAQAAETAVAVDSMPTVVRQVLAAKYPGWTVDHVTHIDGIGQGQYRIRLTDATTAIDVVLDDGGHIVEAARGVSDVVVTKGEPPKPKAEKKEGFGKPEVYGFAQVFFRDAYDTGLDDVVDNSNFRVQRARVGVRGDINSWASYEIEIDPRSPEVGGIMRDAFLRLRVIPNHQIRIGQQKTQFGYENPESSTQLFAVNRTEVSDNLSRGVTLRDIGIGLLGNIPINDEWRFEDAVTLVNGAGMNVQDDTTSKKSIWGRIGVRHRTGPDSWQRLGVSGATGDFIDVDDPADPADDILDDFDRLGVDLEVDHQWFFLSAEYVAGTDHTRGVGVPDPDEPPPEEPIEPETLKPNGWYVNLVGKTPWDVGPIIRYDVFEDTFERWTLGAYYGEADAKLRVMLNYEYRKVFEDAEGNIGRGDDKLYLWTQFRF
jgi:hypothetical protein